MNVNFIELLKMLQLITIQIALMAKISNHKQ